MPAINTSSAMPVAAPVALRHQNPLLPGFMLALATMLLCGALYPAVTFLLGAMMFPSQARGSLIQHQGQVVGSALLAQPFISPGYFRSRPSAVDYDPRAAGGSNWAPSNPALRARAITESQRISEQENVEQSQIPVDLISASGSGLDPHISPASAWLQVPRIARVRGLSPSTLEQLISAHIEAPTLGIWGNHRINVLRLNLALDELTTQTSPVR